MKKTSFSAEQIAHIIESLPLALTHDKAFKLGLFVDTKQYGSQNTFILRIKSRELSPFYRNLCSIRITKKDIDYGKEITIPSLDAMIAKRFGNLMMRGTDFISLNEFASTTNIKKDELYAVIFKRICQIANKCLQKNGIFNVETLYERDTYHSPYFHSFEEMLIWLDMNV